MRLYQLLHGAARAIARLTLSMVLLLCVGERALAVTTASRPDTPNQQEDSTADASQIRRTLLDYIEGTATGDPARLKKAFHPDFKLYAVTENRELLVRSGKQYIDAIKPGEKTNRLGRIVSIDVEHDVATARAEILMPGYRLYTDYFMLVKYQGSWKIVQKSYTWKEVPRPGSRILFVTSNQHTYGATDINAANHFAEIVVAYDIFTKNGYAVDFISPGGGAIPLGYVETSDAVQKAHLYDPQFMNLLKNTLRPADIRPDDYQAVYYSGGGAAMFGVAEDQTIQDIVSKIYGRGGVVSAVCHGTAGIVNLRHQDGTSILLNKKITGFPDLFEDTKADYYKAFPFSIDKEITKNGGNFVYSKKWGDNFYIADGNLITGQDPTSTASVAREVIRTLQKTAAITPAQESSR